MVLGDDGTLRHEQDRQQHHAHGDGDRVVQAGKSIARHGVGEHQHHHDHQRDEQDVHVPGHVVRVFGAGYAGVAAGQGKAGAGAGGAAQHGQQIDVGDRGGRQVGADRQHRAAQRDGPARRATHQRGDEQRGEHGEDELGGHQESGLGLVELEIVDHRADQERQRQQGQQADPIGRGEGGEHQLPAFRHEITQMLHWMILWASGEGR
ncbi:hypothetical protein D3C81_846460 [compost metagenome]